MGVIPTGSSENPEIIVFGPNQTEALHIKISIDNDVIWRWAVNSKDSDVLLDLSGQEGDGTSIDFDEPFVVR